MTLCQRLDVDMNPISEFRTQPTINRVTKCAISLTGREHRVTEGRS